MNQILVLQWHAGRTNQNMNELNVLHFSNCETQTKSIIKWDLGMSCL